MSSPDNRLAVYGTLAPGRPNEHVLADLTGRWFEGRVRGRLVDQGWGAELGYPAIVLDEEAGEVDVMVLESGDLPSAWSRLDDFEGPGYERVAVTVTTAHGDLDASIYVHAGP